MPCASIWLCSTMPPSAARRRSCPSSSRSPIPASRWTGANGGLAFFAYCTNYLIDLKHAVIMDVEATTAVRQAEVTAQRRMLDRTQERFGIWPSGSPPTPATARPRTSPGWCTSAASSRTSRCSTRTAPTAASPARTSPTTTSADAYICPGGKELRQYWQESRAAKAQPPADGLYRYRARKADCDACALRSRCRPGDQGRKLLRSIHEGARDLARDLSLTDAYLTSRRERKKVEMLFAHLKRILKLDRLRLEDRTERRTSSSSPPPPRTSARWPSCSRPGRRRWRAEATQPRSSSAHANVRFCQKRTSSTQSAQGSH